ncbi:unnamed protein product, partial [Iphiclides podalirius]
MVTTYKKGSRRKNYPPLARRSGDEIGTNIMLDINCYNISISKLRYIEIWRSKLYAWFWLWQLLVTVTRTVAATDKGVKVSALAVAKEDMDLEARVVSDPATRASERATKGVSARVGMEGKVDSVARMVTTKAVRAVSDQAEIAEALDLEAARVASARAVDRDKALAAIAVVTRNTAISHNKD